MKKLLLGALLLLGSFVAMAQDTFVVQYHSLITTRDNVKEPWQDTKMTAVFNEKDSNDLVLYYGEGKIIRYKRTGRVEKNKTNDDAEYQYAEYVDSEDGTNVGIQYFNSTETLRVIIADGWYVEFHK